MKNDVFLTLEKSDLKISEDLSFSEVPYFVDVYIETYFDIEKKFGLNLKDRDDVWVNLYAKYNPCDNRFRVDYVISSSNSNVWRVYQPTQAETKMMQKLIDEACIKQTGLTCRDAFIRKSMEKSDEINLVCEEVYEDEHLYQIRNTWDDFVVYTEDETGKLKDHVGHKIEYATYDKEDGYSFSIECADCNEVIFAQHENPEEDLEYGVAEFMYDKYKIIVSPNYNKAIEIGDTVSEVYCRVYHKDDILCKDSLGDFNMMCAFEYSESTVENIENAMRSAMDESAGYYEMALECKTLKRSDELLGRAVSYIIELTGIDELRETLIEKLDMSEEETEKMVQDFSTNDVPEQEMNLG